ncbi:MAG TPA: glycosylase [Micromonosporaceae bacterium]|nr:glycosylase [Micromonosporaceae bacterium]
MHRPDITGTSLATRLEIVLRPDPRRVIVKLFVPGEDAALIRSRAAGLADRIAALDETEVERLLEQTLRRFGSRHHQLEAVFQHHFELVSHRVTDVGDLSKARSVLVGAYFSHEYAVEAAALCNPSMVSHPDQSDVDSGALRVAISLRQIGEGHISSIGFASAVIGPGDRLTVRDRPGPLMVGQRVSSRHDRNLLAAGLAEQGWDNEVSATVLNALPPEFDDDDFDRALAQVPADLMARATAQSTLEQLRRTLAASYSVSFPATIPLEQRVLWPSTPLESNGMEDARFVRFTDDSGMRSYRATYTAYDGRHIGSRMLTSADLTTFDLTPLRGPAARNKGVALFPRTVNGRTLALCRSDGETSGLTTLDDQSQWQTPVPLHTPQQGWELIQVGNCGSPLETEAGWLVLTHGVGPMRRYAIGAMLLDLNHPERVIAQLPGVLLAPDDDDRDGYVPNVVYSCGGLIHEGTLWIPYGVGDTRVRFANIAVDQLLAAMR